MKKIELVYYEILINFEQGRKVLTQSDIAKALNISLSTVNHALSPLKRMGAIRVKKNGFDIVNAKKILFLWASIRNLEKDIIYKTRSDQGITNIEKNMPPDIIYGSYSAYKFLFRNIPADYSEVYVYSNNLEEIKKRFPERKDIPNIFVLKKNIEKMSMALLFADVWNMKEWYAKEFLQALEEKINKIYP